MKMTPLLYVDVLLHCAVYTGAGDGDGDGDGAQLED